MRGSATDPAMMAMDGGSSAASSPALGGGAGPGPTAAAGRAVAGLSLEEQRAWEPFAFMQLADTQLGFQESWRAYGYDEPEGFADEVEMLDQIVDEINRLKPAFCVVCGDMVNAMPQASSAEDREKRQAQTQAFRAACARVDPSVPLVCVCGNHDVGDRPNAATISEYNRDFGDDYFSFWVRGVKCICVNSQLWKDDSEAAALRAEHDRWLRAELASPETAKAKHILVFSHTPPMIFAQDEADGYFNLDRRTRDEVMSLFCEFGVRAVFCGHYHRNAGGWYTPQWKWSGEAAQAASKTVEVVVTGAAGANIVDKAGGEPLEISGMNGCKIGPDVSGVRLVRVAEKDVSHRWCTLNALRGLRTELRAELPTYSFMNTVSADGVAKTPRPA